MDGGVEGEVEAEVIVGGSDLVDFDGDDVRAGDEEGWWGGGFEVDGGFLGACDGGGGGGGPCDGIGGVEIGAHDLPAVEVDDGAVIAEDPDAEGESDAVGGGGE